MIEEYLGSKTLLVTGATGFLGQPLVEKILWSTPNVGRIYVLIRSKKQFGGRVLSAQERLERELYESTVFDRLQSRYKDGLQDFLRQKVVAVAGDISRGGLGLSEDDQRRLLQEVDVVINSAAVVSFDAPLDEALELNVFGARRLAEFAARSEKASLVHVSTAYVCGATQQLTPETLYHLDPQAKPGTPRRITDTEGEIGRIQEVIESVQKEAFSRGVDRELAQVLLKRARRGRSKGSRRREKIENLRRKWLNRRLSEEGMALARRRGWNDTYTYTKALGEQVVAEASRNIPVAVIRPSVIESSLSEPVPGWLDGLRMADPLIVAIGKGRLRSLPLNPNVCLDLVPVDMVVNALLAALPTLTQKGQLDIYHVATGVRNPINLGDLYALIHHYFQQNPMLARDGKPIAVKRLRFPKPGTFRLGYKLRAFPLGTAEKTLARFSVIDATQRVRRRVAAQKAAYERLYYYGEIYEPYLNLNCRFQADNASRLFSNLSSAQQQKFNFDVSRINWRHYIQNVHIPGVKKHILKLEGTGSLELDKETLGEELPAENIFELLARTATRLPDKPALQAKRNGAWATFSYGEVRDRSQEIGRRLLRLGLRKGDRAVLFCENRPEWGVAYLGAASVGIVVVPIDSQSWSREVWSVTRFTGARAIVASEKTLARLPKESLRKNEGKKEPVFLLSVEAFCEPVKWPEYPRSTQPEEQAEPSSFPRVELDDEASIIFTTGTQVDPKGAVHTHRNFLNNLIGVNHYLTVSEEDQLLSVLPLYHALEFSCGFLMAIYGGATVTYVQSLKPKLLLETMREVGTTCMLGVPTLYALIRDDLERRILKSSRSNFKSSLMETSKQFSRSMGKRLRRNIGKRLFSRVHSEFGGKTRVFVSGGSGLGQQLYDDFLALGMPIYEGYGLTETAPVLTVNPLHRSRRGSAGKPLPGVELRLFHPDRDGIGEIIVRTPSLMKEYYMNPVATEKVFRDGWFHTGDLGWVDTDGYLYITGRKKDVIVTGAGKNVYPSDLEAIYQTIPSIKEVCVLGIKSGLSEDVHALIVPTQQFLKEVAPDQRKKRIQKETRELARQLPSYNRLQAIHIVDAPLPRNTEGKIERDQLRRQLAEVLSQGETHPTHAPRSRNREQALLSELSRLSGESIEEIQRDSHLYADLGLDSLMAVELLLFVEEHLGTSVGNQEVGHLQTVGDMLDELRRHHESEKEQRVRTRPPVRSMLPYSDRPARDRALMGATFVVMKGLFRRYFNLSLHNQQLLPKQGAYILAANHSSHLDTAAVISALSTTLGTKGAQKLHVVGARDYFFDSSLKSWFFSTCLNVVPIDREEVSLTGLRMVRAILKSGEPVLIFPEGTRTRTGQLQPFKPGIGLIAWEVGVPIIPVYIGGTRVAWPAGQGLPRRANVSVVFGNPVSMQDYVANGEVTTDDLYRQIALDVRNAVEELSRGQCSG